MAIGAFQTPEFTINGSFGEVRRPDLSTGLDIFVASVQQVSFKIVKEKKEVMRSGTRIKGYKLMSVTGEGTMRGLKVTSDLLRIVGNVMHPLNMGSGVDPTITTTAIPRSILTGATVNVNKHHNVDYKTSIEVTLDDPEALGIEIVQLKSVKIWEVNGGWQVNEVVEEEVPFTFDEIVISQAMYTTLDSYSGDLVNYPGRYNLQQNY